MHHRTSLFSSALILALLALSASAFAAVPGYINYQGILTDAAGDPVVTTQSVVFTIYDAAALGNVLWTETRSVTPDNEGRFSILLGQSVPLHDSVFEMPPLYLGLQVDADPEMTPRSLLATNAFAFRIATLDGATGGSVSGNLNLDPSSSTTGNVLKGGVHFIHNHGTGNTFLGLNAGNFSMTGLGQNTGLGAAALMSNTTGEFNTALGRSVLNSNVDGDRNTASGWAALSSNTSGNDNTASGYQALILNTDGIRNTAVGFNAQFNNSSGDGNTALGALALQSSSTGDSNTAIGFGALFNNFSGSNLTAIGNGADVTTSGLFNATAIGNGARVTASNKIRLGNSSVTVIEGQVAYTFSSDENQKENIQPVNGEEVLRKIRGMKIGSWNYKGQDASQFRHYGPVAQDFFAAFGHDGVGASGSPTTINSGDMAGILMIAAQALIERNLELEAQIEELRTLIKSKP